MAESRVITKQLAGSEDLLKGIGIVTQQRGMGVKTITKLNFSELQGALVVSSLAELNALVIADLGDTKTAIVTSTTDGGIFSYEGSAWVKKSYTPEEIDSLLLSLPDPNSFTPSSTDTLTNKTIDTANNNISIVIADISDFGSYANLSGNNIQRFKVTDAVTADEAITKAQLDAANLGGSGGGGSGASSGVFGGDNNTMDYITIDVIGNATDFGDLTLARQGPAGVSSDTRGVFGGGRGSAQYLNIMDYITIATPSNATDFGDLVTTRAHSAGVSSDVRGIFGGGKATTSSNTTTMDYITIATTSNATTFGDLTAAARKVLAGVSSGTRGVFGGGMQNARTNIMDYITIATASNATDFGDLTVARYGLAGVSSDTRGVFGGGGTGLGGSNAHLNTLDYITIATTSNATDFGDLTAARNGLAGVSSDTRGVFGGGWTSVRVNTMDYITIATISNATDFGDLTAARGLLAGVQSSGGGSGGNGGGGGTEATRGVFGGGATYSYVNYRTINRNNLDYITISTPSNATDFGDLTVARHGLAGVSSDTRGVFGGGTKGSSSNLTPSNNLDYITISTPSNATDFGDLTVARGGPAGVSSGTRGVFGGGSGNTLDYITISTPSNATDFGDLTVARFGLAGVSSDTRGIFGGGSSGGSSRFNTLDYITIATTSNATGFGDLTVARQRLAGVSSDIRGVFGGGYTTTGVNTMDYITISTPSNATNFGDLTVARIGPAGVSSDTRGIFGGGWANGYSGGGDANIVNTLDYITIATASNATDFGDLTLARYDVAGVQGS